MSENLPGLDRWITGNWGDTASHDNPYEDLYGVSFYLEGDLYFVDVVDEELDEDEDGKHLYVSVTASSEIGHEVRMSLWDLEDLLAG